MKQETIFYLSDQATSSDSVIGALENTGYEVVSTNSSTQAIALLYIMHSVAAVVLHHRAREQTSFDVACSLRAIGPGVPVVLLCRDQIDRLPPCVDACVETGQPLGKLTSEVQSLLTAKGFPVHSAHNIDLDASNCLCESPRC
jgi:CheY-like chemotaxis protein